MQESQINLLLRLRKSFDMSFTVRSSAIYMHAYTCIEEINYPDERRQEILVRRKILEIRKKSEEERERRRKREREKKPTEDGIKTEVQRTNTRERTFISLQRHVAAGTGRERHRI